MKRLERLTFVKIDISDETASALKRALPNTNIVVWRSHPTKDMIKAVVLP
jgi:hypothetical protein